MLGRFTSPLARQLGPARAGSSKVRAVGKLLQVRGFSSTYPAAIRIKKSSEDMPSAPSSRRTEDQQTSNEQSASTPQTGSDADTAAASSQKPSSASPFGFSSAGSGLASGILGVEEEAGTFDSHDSKGQHSRDSTSAAEARRARRQRADLPPLEDEPKVKAAKYIGTGLVFGLLIGGIGYYGRPFTAAEAAKGLKDNPEQNALQQLWHRAVRRTEAAFSFLSDPATEKLLPDAAAEYTPPYTLVLNLDDMLIHMDWTKEHGWRIAKRPGLDNFLAYMATMYEVVIFSTQPSHSGMVVMEKLDPLEFAPYRLYKDHMRNIDGKNYKDLTTINRDMAKVIMIDTNADSYKMQPDNVLLGRPFRGDAGDNWIEQITEFLEYVHMMEPKDVRPWIKVYKNLDVAHEFTKWEDAIRKKHADEHEERRKSASGWKSLIWGKMPSESENQPVPEFDQMRKMMREHFAMQHKELLAAIEKERLENEEEMKRQMKDMTVWKMMSQMAGKPASPPDSTLGAAPAQK
ncbi:mitochondrial inner membrane protein required for protein import [Coemansia thaxteri]|uniref:Mitochondrial import inner membrane translocase subunit TIM50 n=1 Tax=Coemansia thaxteri TaxID=2663907 RepID=A0A9W8BEY5_9FUNG|nr:mitochondrial inner membrane protein required for protein import [Coemansia thaxteri]KAJ2004910.1 mitochondrial inner membrane protein required for protein import [Coemansia thaxteri]